MNNTRYIVNTASGEVYAKTNLVLGENDLKRVNSSHYKKAFHLFNGPRKQTGGRQGTKSKEIVKRALKKSHKVRGGRQQGYRAFAIDQQNGECSVLNTMLDELNRLELTNDDGSEYEDNVEMVDEEEVDSDYSTNGIGGETETERHNNNVFRSIEENECNMVGRQSSLFYLHFCMTDLEKNKRWFKILIDSGASINVVPESFVSLLMQGNSMNVKLQDCESSKAKVASGSSMTFEKYNADFDLEFTDLLKLRFKKAKVFKAKGNTLILGKNSFVENRIEIVIRDDELKILVNGEELSSLWSNSSSVPLNKIKKSDEICSVLLTEESPEPLERTPTLHEHMWEKSSSIFENMPPCRAFNPDSEKAWSRKLERIHQEMRNKNTVEDFVVDPHNNVLCEPKRTKIKARLKEILHKYKNVFEGTIGHVSGEEFVITGKIDESKSDRSPKSAPLNYGRNLPESIQKGLEDMLDELASQGVISYLPIGMEPENFLSFFGVAKQTADKAKVELTANNIRIVGDFNRAGINDKTQFAARQADNIHKILQKAAPYTRKGFVCQMDISQMFHCFVLDKALWKHFAIMHPKRAHPLAFRRLPMGWLASPSKAREMITKIMYDHLDYTFIYMDDFLIVGNSEEELLDRVEKVLATLKYRNLRLKGKKCLAFSKDIILLGRRVRDGKICTSDHILKKVLCETPETISTVKMMKRFLGVINYLAICLPRRTEVLWELNAAVAGNKKLADKIEWTQELKDAYLKVAKAINTQLIDLFPIEQHLQTYLVVDSSNKGSGGFLYQLKDGKSQINRLWSKKRGDYQIQAQWSSCSLELHGILCAVLCFYWEIDFVTRPVVVITDSLSVQKLFERARQGKDLSLDRRINDQIVKLLNFDIEIVYQKGESTQIHLADFISRSESLLQPCSDKCAICDLAKDKVIAQKEDLGERWNLVSFIYEPAVDITKFEEIYALNDEKQFKREAERLTVQNCFTMNTLESEVDEVVLRSKNKRLDRRVRALDKEVDVITNLRNQLMQVGTPEVLNNRQLIRNVQMASKTVGKALMSKRKNGRMPGPKDRRAETLRNSTFVCENGKPGILKKRKITVGSRVVEPVVIPLEFAQTMIDIFHNGNCGTITRLVNIIRCELWCEKLEVLVRDTVNKCLTCSYQRKRPKIMTEIKEYDEEDPQYLGELIYADVITRNAHKEHDETTYKFWVFSEALSGYTKVYPIRNNENNSAKGTDIMIQAMKDFNRGVRACRKVHVRMDGSSVNKGIANRDIWKIIETEIDLPVKLSTSKNALAPLDSRIQKLSPVLQTEIWERADPRIISFKLEERLNNTKSAHGFSPYEIWHGRTTTSNMPIAIPIEAVKEFVKQARSKSRKSKMINEMGGRIRLPLILKPFEEGDKYGLDLSSPIKIGDYCLIEGSYDKNSQHPWFKVVASQDIPTGIDWIHGQIQTQRMGLKYKKFAKWHFSAIKTILDGRNINDIDGNIYSKAMKAFKEQNRELSMIEWMKPRSEVFAIEQWPYGKNMPADGGN